MHIVGIIGPYISGFNRRRIDHNIANARYVTRAIANRFAESHLVGFFCPHTHTAQMEVFAEAKEPYYHALDDILYDRACEAFVLLPDWQQSSGAKRDYERAIAHGRPLFDLKSYADEDITALLDSLNEWAKALDESC